MDRDYMNDPYFLWLCEKVSKDGFSLSNYSSMFLYLYEKEFTWIIERDADRAADGIAMRDRFCRETGLYARFWTPDFCSVLEMLVALCDGTCDRYFSDIEADQKRREIFWILMQNSNLACFEDAYFDAEKVDFIVQNAIDRRYEPDGKGGFFVDLLARFDMRKVAIWYQMSILLEEVYGI